MKRTIRLRESELRQMIAESVKNNLNEELAKTHYKIMSNTFRKGANDLYHNVVKELKDIDSTFKMIGASDLAKKGWELYKKSLDVVNYLDGFADDIDSYVDYHSDMIPDQ